MKKVLITGAGSYVGTNFKKFLQNYSSKYNITTISVRDDQWKTMDFSKFDVIFHVAAVVHKREKKFMEGLYQKVNCDLPVALAEKAKNEGVKQFIFMSTMGVYGILGELKKEVVITKETPVNPKTFYAISKLEAEKRLKKFQSEGFIVTILRPPMIYGPNSPGNFAKLEKIAKITPIFPKINNQRSMIHIDKFASEVKRYIDVQRSGIFFSQDDQYIVTSEWVKSIAKKNGKNVHLSRFLGIIFEFFRNAKIVKKVFGNLIYER
ncbi:MAG: NAD-dependent epimerase/dehydratase family protein [Streptococcaceae bacterium]|jgi:UDP-glucose 4-epimerase|nr:NAD-dependent epimerase/dehydratase family protein [Streptococcaceae bacterium]